VVQRFSARQLDLANSRQIVARVLGDLPAALRAKLMRENVARLYNISAPIPVETTAGTNGLS
jgi:hypothetical protein